MEPLISNIKIEGFKGIQKADIDLAPFTVIIGPNASGKTSVLEAILLWVLGVLKEEPTSNISSDWDEYIRRGSDSANLFVTSSFSEGRVDFKRGQKAILATVPKKISIQSFDTLGEYLGEVNLYQFDPAALAKPAEYMYSNLRLKYNGEGLSTILSDMNITGKAGPLDSIRNSMAHIIPGFQSFSFERERFGNRDSFGYRLKFDFDEAVNLRADMCGDGTLLSLAILTAIASGQKLILIDEIERGLHPTAMKSLVEQIRELMKIHPDIQIIATTHSPYFVDFMDWNEIVISYRDESGSCIFGKMEDSPDYPKWSKLMDPGEFWSTFGEKKILNK